MPPLPLSGPPSRIARTRAAVLVRAACVVIVAAGALLARSDLPGRAPLLAVLVAAVLGAVIVLVARTGRP